MQKDFVTLTTKELFRICKIFPLIVVMLLCCVPNYYGKIAGRMRILHNHLGETQRIIDIDMKVNYYEDADLEIDYINKKYDSREVLSLRLKIFKGSKHVFVFKGPVKQVYLNGNNKSCIIVLSVDKFHVGDSLDLNSNNCKSFIYYGQTDPEFMVEYGFILQGRIVIHSQTEITLEGNFDFEGKTYRYMLNNYELGWINGQITGFKAATYKIKRKPVIIEDLPPLEIR